MKWKCRWCITFKISLRRWAEVGVRKWCREFFSAEFLNFQTLMDRIPIYFQLFRFPKNLLINIQHSYCEFEKHSIKQNYFKCLWAKTKKQILRISIFIAPVKNIPAVTSPLFIKISLYYSCISAIWHFFVFCFNSHTRKILLLLTLILTANEKKIEFFIIRLY